MQLHALTLQNVLIFVRIGITITDSIFLFIAEKPPDYLAFWAVGIVLCGGFFL
jgi:hypothetical protein